mmetsp:Transcript_61550/g.150667  ORF Transcript_61550/g.150667 Transcript_61550/m.150667 type:complete len:341 (-) Transcript_61550:79-1101(-)
MSGRCERNGGMTMVPSADAVAPATVATIDLHGYRKSEAIRALTDFLDHVSSSSSNRNGNHNRRRQDDKATIAATTTLHKSNNATHGNDGRNNSVWCLVVTGTGAHSPEGPVIRGAVQALFEKRRMKYHLNKGGGSFNVDAMSGIILMKGDEPTDTKVIVSSLEDVQQQQQLERGTVAGSRKYRKSETKGWYTTKQQQQMGDDQIMLQKAYRQQQNEHKALKRAVSNSALELEKEQKVEEERIEQALKQSILDSEVKQKQEDDQIEQVLKLSIHDNHDIIEEEKQLQEALEHSARELQQQATKVEENDDEALQKLLELSRKEYEQEQNELLKVLEKSAVEF